MQHKQLSGYGLAFITGNAMMTPNEEKLVALVGNLLQELQEFVDEAQKAGSDLPGTRALIEEGEQILHDMDPWQQHINTGDKTEIAALQVTK